MRRRRVVEGKRRADVYPESFQHDHDPGDDWILLIHLAEHLGEICAARESNGWIPGYPLPTKYVSDEAPAENEASVSDDGV